jgi:hypothetical protein
MMPRHVATALEFSTVSVSSWTVFAGTNREYIWPSNTQT